MLLISSFFSLFALPEQAIQLDINIPDISYPNKPLLRQLNQNFALCEEFELLLFVLFLMFVYTDF